ncbi:MAG: hypothetical protein OXU78_01900 [Deltaproteobacteria bacterium]|nr:hypothetical protein [Deltaproteobacteria bacterium]
MKTSQNPLIGTLQAISWIGVCVFGAGQLATHYILSDLFSMEISDSLDTIIIVLWIYPFVLLNARKQRRLGLFPTTGDAQQESRPKTRWQAFDARFNSWPDSIRALFGLPAAWIALAGGKYMMSQLGTGYAELLGIAVLLAIGVIPLWIIQRRRKRADQKGDEA